MERTHFIYGLRDPESKEIRYVGMSTNPRKRFQLHIWEARTGRGCQHNSDKQRWLGGLLERGLRPELEILQECDLHTWRQQERYWITYLRDSGVPLLNIRDGGDTVSWQTEESRRWRSERMKGHPVSAETRRAISEAQKGREVPQWKREQIAATLRGRKNPHEGHKWSEEQKAKYVASMKELRDSGAPKLKEQFRNMLVSRNTPEYRKKLSDAMKRRWERRESALLVETEAKAEQRRKRVLARWSKT